MRAFPPSCEARISGAAVARDYSGRPVALGYLGVGLGLLGGTLSVMCLVPLWLIATAVGFGGIAVCAILRAARLLARRDEE